SERLHPHDSRSWAANLYARSRRSSKKREPKHKHGVAETPQPSSSARHHLKVTLLLAPWRLLRMTKIVCDHGAQLRYLNSLKGEGRISVQENDTIASPPKN